MEVRRDRLMDYISIPASLIVCSMIMYDISVVYIMIEDINSNTTRLYENAVYFLQGNMIVVLLCAVSQTFCNKVRSVVGVLKDVRCQLLHEPLKLQVQYLISLLKDSEVIDAGGWYTLGYGTLVSAGSFVATYVVVLLQVGGNSRTAAP
ncbi:uncharacterized protein [Penaeus vannamei]|uniref:uncharacterized protein n=1 Tax=Penaeus vannamei TaxID=6689 RepID=UPI00387F4D4F